MRNAFSAVAISVVLGLGVTAATARAERYVVVNGSRLSEDAIERLEQEYCGPIPNGNYWYDAQSGIWGYAGNPVPQGNIHDNCIAPGRRPSLSERGMLFGPEDWTRDP